MMNTLNKSFIPDDNEVADEHTFLVNISNSSSYITNDEVITILQNIYDPEISYSLYDLGLIYSISISDTTIDIIMTLTTVNCPEAQSLPDQVMHTLQEVFKDVIITVNVVFEPPWTVDNMAQSIKLSLGLL